MIRTKMRQHVPVYREVLKHAILSAWRDRRYWPLAFLSSVLLTGSFYDVTINFFHSIAERSTAMGTASVPDFSILLHSLSENVLNVFNLAFALQALIAVAVISLAFVAISCVAQGGLVYALGATRAGKTPTLKEAFRVGGGAFWPVAAVNALAISVIWVLRFFITLPLYLAVSSPDQFNILLYTLSFIVFVPLIFVTCIVQIFSLNAMILQGAPAADAIARSYHLFKKHWITTLETAFLLFCMTLFVSIVVTSLLFVLAIPLFIAVLVAAFVQSTVLLYTALGISLAVVLVGGVVAASYMTQLHYATWTYLYRKIGEGGVVPKLHRWARTLTGVFTVPQS